MARLTRAEAKQQTRERLLATAGDVFAERGFTGATVDEIVERAGFTRGAFYANFRDKADAFLTLLEESRRHEMAEAAALIAGTPDEEKLGALQAWYDSLGSGRWDLAYAELWPQAGRDPSIQARVAARHLEVRDTIAAILRAYLETAPVALPVPPEQVASMILAVGDGVAAQRQLNPGSVPDDLFTSTVAFLWFGLLAGTDNPM
jgi:AcrR family transcriptional regulator